MQHDGEFLSAASACFSEAPAELPPTPQRRKTTPPSQPPSQPLQIDLKTYHPVEETTHYGELFISSSGSCHAAAPLPGNLSAFIRDLHKELSQWDGRKGEYGRDYQTLRSQTQAITAAQADALRAQYIELKESHTPRAVLDKLRKDLDKQSRTQNQLHQSVLDMQRKIDRLRKHRDTCEMGTGQSDTLNDLDDRLLYYMDELDTLNQAYKQMVKKVVQTEMELSDRESARLRRFALLRRIFGEEPLRGGLLTAYCDTAELTAGKVNKADEQSMRKSLVLFQAKCFYADAVIGKAHLYKVESALKTILENLREAMNGLTGGAQEGSMTARSPERGQEFRLRYVRRLWNALDADFKTALPYIQETSLKQEGLRHKHDCNTGPGLNRQFSFSSPSGRTHTIFNHCTTVLPSFTKIELSHPLSKKGKVTALYRCAARAYKEVNAVYDCHEDMTAQALGVVQTCANDNRQALDGLIGCWEELLGT